MRFNNFLLWLLDKAFRAIFWSVDFAVYYLIAALGAAIGLLPWGIASFLATMVKYLLLFAGTAIFFVLLVVGWRRYGDGIMRWLTTLVNRDTANLDNATYWDYANSIREGRLGAKR